MNCPACRGQMRVKRENYLYEECGLSNVVLRSVNVWRCTSCEQVCVEIPRLEELHQGIAEVLLQKPERLSGQEIRYLRTHIGWSGRRFATQMRVKPETVSRWEAGTQKIGLQADLLLRVYVRLWKKDEDYFAQDEREALKTVKRSRKIEFESHGHAWEPKAACWH